MLKQKGTEKPLKVGLVACKSSGVPYKVLYTQSEVDKHNKQKGMLKISWELFCFVEQLPYNKKLVQAIQAFRQRFGSVADDEKKQLKVMLLCRELQESITGIRSKKEVSPWNVLHLHNTTNYKIQTSSFKIKLPREMEAVNYADWNDMVAYMKELYYGKKHPTRRRIKDVGGYYMLPLFYGGIIDTGCGVNQAWDSDGISVVKRNGLNPSVDISLRYGDVTKNKVLTYVEQHWKEIYDELKTLQHANKYFTEVKYTEVIQLRDIEHFSWNEIANIINEKHPRSKGYSVDNIRKTYKEAKTHIDKLF